MKINIKSLSIASIVLVVLVFLLAGLLVKENKTKNELVAEFTLEKEDLENEYTLFAQQYDELQIQVKNDSLGQLLDKEQTKVRQLLSELQMVKSSNAREIRRLKKQLTSLRKVMRSFVAQIDSLNRVNAQQKEVIKRVTRKYQQTRKERDDLKQVKKQLDQQVALASQLDATNIHVYPKTKRKRIARRVKDVKQFQIDFTIAKNITATPGERVLYVRILKPDNSVLTRGLDHTFAYENTSLHYSIKKFIEYTGESQAVTVYWDVKEFLYAGTYQVDIFAEDNLIGSYTFTIKK